MSTLPIRRRYILVWLIALLVAVAPVRGELVDVSIKSTVDGTLQPSRWYAPPEADASPVPLLVVLHTWSGDYRQDDYTTPALDECTKRNWALLHPNFRGPNVRPEACASRAAIADVLDAVAFAQRTTRIDPERIYHAGTSGGGHMALMMAAARPDLWAGVSAWVPVVDLAAWHAESKAAGRKYWRNLEAVCGDAPGVSAAADAEYRARSPLVHLPRARGLAIDLNVGIHDGHTGAIPVSHSLRAFNVLAEANGERDAMLSDDQVAVIRQTRKIPADLIGQPVEEDRQRAVLFRRAAGPVRLTIFDGGHEGDVVTAIQWLSRQQRK